MASGPERRKEPRHSKSAPLILLEKTDHDVREGAILRDVSLGGIAFETSLALEKGDTFTFALYIPTRGWVDGRGRICWVKPEADYRLCGASIEIREWDQSRLLEKWLKPAGRGILRYFFPDEGPKAVGPG